MMEKMKQRESIFDLLRIIAAFFVIMIHVSADYINNQAAPQMLSWNVALAFNVISRFSVPMFFMISGRFLLDPLYHLDGKKVGAKIGRLLLALFVWSIVYYLLNHAVSGVALHQPNKTFESVLEQLMIGEYHFWFLWVLIGLYLAAPLMRMIVKDDRSTIWFLSLFCIFQIAVPLVEYIPKIGGVLSRIDDTIQMKMVVGYAGYYVLGYALYRFQIGKRYRLAVYAAGIICTALCFLLIVRNSKAAGRPLLAETEYLHPLVIISSIAAYLAAIQIGRRWPDVGNNVVVSAFSSQSFGIYLTHVLFVTLGCAFHLMWWIHPLISIPVNTLVIMLLSFCLTWLIRRIPQIGMRIT